MLAVLEVEPGLHMALPSALPWAQALSTLKADDLSVCQRVTTTYVWA